MRAKTNGQKKINAFYNQQTELFISTSNKCNFYNNKELLANYC